MKKLWLAGAATLAAFSLAACGTAKNSSSAKAAYIDDFVALNATSYNAHDVTVKVDQFKITGDNSKATQQMSQLFNKAQFDIKTDLDSKNKIADFASTLNFENNSYQLGGLLNSDGIYLKSSDIKNLFDKNKKLIPEASLYGAMLNGLTKPYLSFDATMLNQSLKQEKQNITWADTVNELFNQQSVDKKTATDTFKDIPAADFSQSGDDVTVKITEKNGNVADFLKKFKAVSSTLSASQLQQFLQEAKDLNYKTISLSMTENAKSATATGSISCELFSKSDKNTSFDYKLNLSSKSAKDSKALSKPSPAQTESFQELEGSLFSNLIGQQGATAS